MLTPILTRTITPNALFNGPNRVAQFIDLGTSVVVNGVRYSPDLVNVLGAWQDTDSVLPYMLAPQVATSWPTVGSSQSMSPNNGSIVLYNSAFPRYVIGDDGWRIAVQHRTYSLTGQIAPTSGKLVRYNETGIDSNVVPLSSIAAVYGIVRDTKATRSYSSLIDVWGQNTTTNVYKYTQSGNGIDTIGTLNNSNFINSTGAHAITNFIPTSTGYVPFVSRTDSTSSSWYVMNPTNLSVVAGVGYSPVTTCPIRPICVVMDEGKFYVIDMPLSPSQRSIKYCTLANSNVTAAPTRVVCSGDMSPIQTFEVLDIATGGDSDMRLTGRVVTQGANKYLVVIVHPVCQIPDTSTNEFSINMNNMIAVWKIDANDPSVLTLIDTKRVPRAAVVLMVGSRIYASNTNDVMVYDISSGAIVHIGAFGGLGVRHLIETETKRVFGLDGYTNTIHNLTIPSVKCVSAQFSATGYDTSAGSVSSSVYLDVSDGGYQPASVVDLTLSGPVIFNSNSQQTIRVTTTADARTVVPVTINGVGAISVTPKLVS